MRVDPPIYQPVRLHSSMAWAIPGRVDWRAGRLPIFANVRYARVMSTMNISLPDSLKEFVDNQVGSLGYGSSSEYMRELIRKDRDRQQLRGLLFEGAASPQSATIDSGYFDNLRSRVRGATDR